MGRPSSGAASTSFSAVPATSSSWDRIVRPAHSACANFSRATDIRTPCSTSITTRALPKSWRGSSDGRRNPAGDRAQGRRRFAIRATRSWARALDFNVSVDATQLRDLVVIGAGPAGLAAAVYAASEGLDSRHRRPDAGRTGRLVIAHRDNLGLPKTISGLEPASRALAQASKFGAQFLIGSSVACLSRDPNDRTAAVQASDGSVMPARAAIVATGASYRRLPLPNVQRFEGVGVYYSATHIRRNSVATSRWSWSAAGIPRDKPPFSIANRQPRSSPRTRAARRRQHVAVPGSAHRRESEDRFAHAVQR